MPDVFSLIAWAIAIVSLLVGAQLFGLIGLLAILVGCAIVLAITGVVSGRRRLSHRHELEARFLPTDEIFRDPASGELMRVHVDPVTGERRYKRQ